MSSTRTPSPRSSRRSDAERKRIIATLFLLAGLCAFSALPWLALVSLRRRLRQPGYERRRHSFLQLGVAEIERGRIMALWSSAFLGLGPVASLVDGCHRLGVRVAGIVLFPTGAGRRRAPDETAAGRGLGLGVLLALERAA
jgi:hypothetical protein